jgi:hypothetical protein
MLRAVLATGMGSSERWTRLSIQCRPVNNRTAVNERERTWPNAPGAGGRRVVAPDDRGCALSRCQSVHAHRNRQRQVERLTLAQPISSSNPRAQRPGTFAGRGMGGPYAPQDSVGPRAVRATPSGASEDQRVSQTCTTTDMAGRRGLRRGAWSQRPESSRSAASPERVQRSPCWVNPAPRVTAVTSNPRPSLTTSRASSLRLSPIPMGTVRRIWCGCNRC